MTIHIDGSMGEGGGQVVRSSLSLAMLTGRGIRVSKVRAKRRKPGLLRQHLTAAQAAAMICGDPSMDARLGSTELRFKPGKVRAGDYELKVGTAGSAMLVLQTVLLPLCLADGPSRLVLEGGTHNPWAPTFDFLDLSFLPLLRRMGASVTATLERPGFYPAGGGRAVVEIEPVARLRPLHLLERGEILERRAIAQVANLSRGIAERELKAVRASLGWRDDQLELREVALARGPGNVLSVVIGSEQVTEVFVGFGRAQTPAKQVAEEACHRVRHYLAAGVPVGRFLADQLLLPLAVAGSGSFHTIAPSRHTLTQQELLSTFLEIEIDIQKIDANRWLAKVREPAAVEVVDPVEEES